MVDITIVGSIALDSIKTPFGSVKEVLGGAATYSSYAASYFAKPGVVAVVGDDFPQEHLQLLTNRKIDLNGVKREGKTFRWNGYYEYDMNDAKTVKTELNSFENFKPELPAEYKDAKYVFLANINPELQLNVLDQMDEPELVVLDTMNLWIDSKRDQLMEVIKRTDVLLLNETEARQLFETPNLVKAASTALRLGPKHVVIKKGEHGAIYLTSKNFFVAPSYPLEVIKDPTGCGDCFAGGFLGYIAKTKDTSEKNIRRAIIYGSVIASFNAEDFSLNRLKSITMDDIDSRYQEFKKMRDF